MIGILIISHGTLGESLIHCASHVLNKRPLRLKQLGLTAQDDPTLLLPQTRNLVKELDAGNGVLILTDMYGGTPSNMAAKLEDIDVGGACAEFEELRWTLIAPAFKPKLRTSIVRLGRRIDGLLPTLRT